MSKKENIFDLYEQLTIKGTKTDALFFIADLCGVTEGTIANHWVRYKRVPRSVSEQQQTQIKAYLKKAIKLQDKAIKNIEVL